MKKIFNLAIILSLIISLSSCGTIFKHKQIGKSHYKKLDPNIVALDSAAFALFIVPGFVAITLDYFTGTLYIPYNGPEIHHSADTTQSQAKPATKPTTKTVKQNKDSNTVTVDVDSDTNEKPESKEDSKKEVKEEKIEPVESTTPTEENSKDTKESDENVDDIFADD